jgi:glycosyltransferase involved in cell wall biosynthesis
MHIAYLVNQYPKVSHTFIRREILALEKLGFDVVRIALRGWDLELPDPDDQRERERTRYALRGGALPLLHAAMMALVFRPGKFFNALVLALRTGWLSERPLAVHGVYLAEACLIERWLRERGVRHLHAHFGTNSATVAMLVGALGGPPWSFTVHGPEEFDKPRLISLAEKVRRCNFVAAISSFGRSQLYRLADHRHWHKVKVVHCGLEPAFHDGIDRAPSDSKALICVGRLAPQKGHLLLLEAARLLAAQGRDFKLVFAGDGELRGEIEELARRQGLADRLRITGWISSEQVRREILSARALVLPSFAEGLPVVIMEAMALERPVVSTFVAGIPELVADGEHGWLVPAGDVCALVGAIRSCLDAELEELRRMGAAARQRVFANHDVDTEVTRLAQLFRPPRAGQRDGTQIPHIVPGVEARPFK